MDNSPPQKRYNRCNKYPLPSLPRHRNFLTFILCFLLSFSSAFRHSFSHSSSPQFCSLSVQPASPIHSSSHPIWPLSVSRNGFCLLNWSQNVRLSRLRTAPFPRWWQTSHRIVGLGPFPLLLLLLFLLWLLRPHNPLEGSETCPFMLVCLEKGTFVNC